MNDRELLEAAARAVGLEHRGYVDDFFDPELNVSIGLMYGCPTCVWNPLTDDGDAFRLMVDLDMNVMNGIARNSGGYTCIANECGDNVAATRRAIVMAAAEMEKT